MDNSMIKKMLKMKKINRTLYKQAMQYYTKRQFEDAIYTFEELLTGAKNSLMSHTVKFYYSCSCRKEAERLYGLGNYTLAANYLQKASEISPNNSSIISFLASCYVKEGDFASAAATYGRACDLNTGESYLTLKRAMSYQLSGQSDQAITLLEDLAKKHPNSFDVVFNLGTILASQNHLSPAVLHLTKAVQLRPEDVEAHWKLGLAKGLMGHTLEAVRHLEIAHTIQPDNHWLLCHLTLGVQQATLQGIEAFPQIVHSSEGKTLGSEKELTALADLIAKEPEFVTAFLDLPKSDVDQSIFSALLTILVRSLEKYPEYADLHYHCSCVLDRLGQKERAICESKRALEINPRYVNALIHLAKVYASTHQNQEAIDRLSKAIELGANFADVHYLLGNLYRKQGCLEHARQHYRKALKLNERYYAAKEAMGELVHS